MFWFVLYCKFTTVSAIVHAIYSSYISKSSTLTYSYIHGEMHYQGIPLQSKIISQQQINNPFIVFHPNSFTRREEKNQRLSPAHMFPRSFSGSRWLGGWAPPFGRWILPLRSTNVKFVLLLGLPEHHQTLQTKSQFSTDVTGYTNKGGFIPITKKPLTPPGSCPSLGLLQRRLSPSRRRASVCRPGLGPSRRCHVTTQRWTSTW